MQPAARHARRRSRLRSPRRQITLASLPKRWCIVPSLWRSPDRLRPVRSRTTSMLSVKKGSKTIELPGECHILKTMRTPTLTAPGLPSRVVLCIGSDNPCRLPASGRIPRCYRSCRRRRHNNRRPRCRRGGQRRHTTVGRIRFRAFVVSPTAGRVPQILSTPGRD